MHTSHRALLNHPTLGALRRLDSFPEHSRDFFEGLIGVFDMHCIHLNGGRYIIEGEYEAHNVCGSERDFDIEADIEADCAKSVSDGSYDLLQAAYEEIRNQDQHALLKKGSIEQAAKYMMTTGCDNVFVRAACVHPFWRDAAVVAGQFATPENINAFNHAVAALENALLNGAGHEDQQIEFQRQLLAMASPTAVANFDQFWPNCRMELKPGIDSVVVSKIVRRLRATINGWRGEPYGSDTPAAAMDAYLWHCIF